MKTLQGSFNDECNSLKIAHADIVRNLHENNLKFKDQIKDLEFQSKSEKLTYQQQILNLQTEVFGLKSEISVLQNLKKNNENEV